MRKSEIPPGSNWEKIKIKKKSGTQNVWYIYVNAYLMSHDTSNCIGGNLYVSGVSERYCFLFQ